MSETDTPTAKDLLAMTAEIAAAHLSATQTPADEIPALIQKIHKTLSTLTAEGNATSPAAERPQPAVPIKRSVTPEYIICLEDGKKLKMLKRHLKTAYGMSPESYRERWGLPADYPMTAPAYAKRRSTLARDIGLGKRSRKS